MFRLLLLWGMAIISSNVATYTGCWEDPPCGRNQQCDAISYNCSNIKFIKLTTSSLPSALNVKSLRDLRMTKTSITEIDEDFFLDKEDLQRLFLSENELKSLHYKIFNPLVLLEYLDLSHNKLEYLNSTLFSAQKKLQSLILSNNNFKAFLEAALFSSLTELKRLDLSYNGISFFTESLFTSLKDLRVLLLTSNKIVSISKSLVFPLRSLKELHAERNGFICNCELYGIVMMLKSRVEVLKGKCRYSKLGFEISLYDIDYNAACEETRGSKSFVDNNTQRTTDIFATKEYESSGMPRSSTTEYISAENTTEIVSSTTTQMPNAHRHRRGNHGITNTILIVVLTLMALQMACCIFGALWYWKKKFGSSRKRRQEILVDNEIRRNNEYEYEYVTSPPERAINLPELPARPIASVKGDFSKFHNNFSYERFSSPKNESTLKNNEMCETYDYAYEVKPNSSSVKDDFDLKKNNLVDMSNVGAAFGNGTSGQEFSVRATQNTIESCDKAVQEDSQYEAIEQDSGKQNRVEGVVMVENILYSEN